jgi:hypothetical protein
MVIKLLVLASCVFSAVVCHGLAARKGKNKVFWGATGFLLGPFAIAFLLVTHDAKAQATELLEPRVKYFLDLGLLDKQESKSFAHLVQKISLKFSEQWGKDWEKQFKQNDPLIDLLLLQYGSSKIWWQDTEADVLNGNNVYVQTLKQWATISEWVYAPTNIVESWQTDNGPVELSFDLNDTHQKIVPTYQQDYLDMDILKQINKLIPDSESKFEMLVAFDQAAFVLWLDKTEKASLVRRGWRFAW